METPRLTMFQGLAPLSQQAKLTRVAHSKDWFIGKLRETMKSDAPTSLSYASIVKAKGNQSITPQGISGTGKMYMFLYQAKTDAKLDYWDAFPLIFNVETGRKGFVGINIHYLPLDFRARLFDAIYELTVKGSTFDQRTLLTYQLLGKVAKFSIAKPAVKHYLFTQMRSRMIQIGAENWETALYLPTDDWIRSTNSKVWQDTRDAIAKQSRTAQKP